MPAAVKRYGVDLTACWRPRVGMVTLAVELTRALVQAGERRRFVLFCSRARPSEPDLPDAEAVISPYRDERLNKLVWLRRVEAETELAAILYPYWPSPAFRNAAAPAAAVFVHDLAFRVRPDEVPWQQRAYLGTLLPIALEGAAAVLVPSHSTRADLLAHYPVPDLEQRLHVVPEGSGSLPAGDLPAGLQPGFLLAVGTVERRKNYARLLAAYRALRAGRPDTPELVVAGRPGWAYGSMVDDLRREAGVRYLGHVDEATLGALYTAAGTFVFPSLYEGFGLPLLEAMQAGLPAVIGNRGALPELAGGGALQTDVEDVDALTAAIERVMADTALRRKLAKAARARAQTFTWKAAADAVLPVLDAISEPK